MATREEVDLMDSDSDDGQRALPAPSRVGQPPVDSDSDDELPVLAPPKPKPDLDRWRKNNATPPKNSTVLIDLTNSPGDLPGFLPPPGKTSGPPSDRSPGSTPPRPVSAPVVFAKPKLVLPVNDSYSTFDASFRAPSKPLPAEQTPDSPPPPDSAGPDGVHPALALLTSDPDPSLLADVDQPRDLTVRLMPHQLVGLRFLVGQERASARRGGILADDMGLGKTVQTIALILANRPRPDPALAFGQPKDRKATLVVATKALAPQWAREVKSKTRPGALSVLVYHGPVRPRDPRVLERYDVVITTYSTLEAERRSHAGSDAEAERELGTLFRARWLRVVLDEAHLIKNRAAKSSVAACHLDASYRLCLTGTPCQNSLEDVHSLLKFLRIPPYDDHKLFKSEVLEPYKRAKGNQAVLALERLRAVLATVMLRRTKASVDGAGKPLLELPPKDVDLVRCELGERERAFYDSLEGRMRAEFEGMAAAEQRKYTTVLTLILRLRQCCDHPALVGAVEEEEAEVDRELRGASAGSEVDGLSERLASFSVSSSAAAGKGPVSREKKNAAVLARLLRSWTPSAKTDAAMDLLRRELEEDAGNKVCVFSQFTSFLDVFEIPLREAGYRFVRYDGTMSIAQREEVLASFRNNKNVRIMLISLKCGSLGLNLVCANKVIVLDPWWNGTIEDQAVDRVHRIG
ncbi:SNF2 family N-terminal domain-containing protein [Hyaloraphidium curvatum]|nr:SNF2 family N-terminal domain-containing protein [Hyaloraphidium curvatum]